ncbi:Piso0_005033 [Millerozyma farinosa CBS 7064]|uniref:Piso0_005033 protein n=1 Tax=Pichia sorbitophila (strain ATCC MYA-4447 / BCRC 22081 / CBS 7064 / NBRC 10061 / NRRL Y-12695) TaxID=559304 RepID=G8Y135_PICSO|nr:Piso0_005033 [Millerozyma farinosa CBS 7064]
MSLGKVTHYACDLVLVSIILAGIHRNTGLVFDTSNLSSIDFRRWIAKYLKFGEKCYDYTVYLLKVSGYFKQNSLVFDRLSSFATKETRSDLGLESKEIK